VSDALEILSSGGFVLFDGLLLRLDRELWPWARAVSCFVELCKTEAPGKVYLYIHHILNTHITHSFGSRDQNWGPCRCAQMSLRMLLYGSPVLCGAVAWLVLVMVMILVRREVK
jgi:hypothetical protein